MQPFGNWKPELLKKDGELTREQTHAAKVEVWLNQTIDLLHLANEMVNVAKGEAAFI